ncbi:MAG: decaprenyl-phosphate phosphoribosyltransferase [Acidimicrobiia bacterium]
MSNEPLASPPERGVAPRTMGPARPQPIPEPPPLVETGWRSTFAGGLVRTARPKQWIKNVFVFAAPGAAGVAFEPATMAPVLATFVAWCLVSSGTYFLNDAVDVHADRHHPRKRYRPVAAGMLSPRLATVVAVTLLALAVGSPFAWGAPGVAGLLAAYAAITIAYSLWLKHEPVIDLAAVASGFVLRAISGGVAAEVPISNWFLIVASFGSLFMVAGKRHAEHVDLRDDSARIAHRATLEAYTPAFLRYVRTASSSVAITAYCLWAFEKAEAASSVGIAFQLSIIPFVLAIFRYALLLDAGRGDAPEDIVLSDRTLQILGVVWVAVFAVGVHAG